MSDLAPAERPEPANSRGQRVDSWLPGAGGDTHTGKAGSEQQSSAQEERRAALTPRGPASPLPAARRTCSSREGRLQGVCPWAKRPLPWCPASFPARLPRPRVGPLHPPTPSDTLQAGWEPQGQVPARGMATCGPQAGPPAPPSLRPRMGGVQWAWAVMAGSTLSRSPGCGVGMEGMSVPGPLLPGPPALPAR